MSWLYNQYWSVFLTQQIIWLFREHVRVSEALSTESHNQICLNNLSLILMQAFSQRYPKASTSFLANEFNLRALNVPTISGETMRKWRSGSSMPAPGHLTVLRKWLDLDLNKVFSSSMVVRSGHPIIVEDENLAPYEALDYLDQTIKALVDTRKVISLELRKVELARVKPK